MNSNTRTAIAWISAAAIVYVLANHSPLFTPSAGQDDQTCSSQMECDGSYDYCNYYTCR